jgi:hypothetical protein
MYETGGNYPPVLSFKLILDDPVIGSLRQSLVGFKRQMAHGDKPSELKASIHCSINLTGYISTFARGNFSLYGEDLRRIRLP